MFVCGAKLTILGPHCHHISWPAGRYHHRPDTNQTPQTNLTMICIVSSFIIVGLNR